MWHRTIDCLGVAVDIGSRVEELDDQLAAVLRSYADSPARPAVSYRLEVADWPRLVRDGEVVDRFDLPIDLVAGLELDLYAQVMARAEGVLLHAGAVVGAGGDALVLAGRSGAGKSTLVRALLARGYSYLTEECVSLRSGGVCTGLARALHVTDGNLAVPAGFRCDDYPLRGLAGAPPRLFHPPERAMWRGEARVRALVAIDHAPGADSLEPLGGGASLAVLWPLLFRRDHPDMAAAASALGAAPRFELRTSRPDQAEARVLRLAAELDVAPS